MLEARDYVDRVPDVNLFVLVKGPCFRRIEVFHTHGTEAAGTTCRLCQWMFPLSGLKAQHKTLEGLRKAMELSTTLVEEVQACINTLIDKINDGSVV